MKRRYRPVAEERQDADISVVIPCVLVGLFLGIGLAGILFGM